MKYELLKDQSEYELIKTFPESELNKALSACHSGLCLTINRDNGTYIRTLYSQGKLRKSTFNALINNKIK
jgi:hypothetical protein